MNEFGKEISKKPDLRIIGKSRSDFSNNLYTVKARNTTYDRPFNNLIQPYKTEHDDEWKNLTENETDRKETITFTPRWSDNGICQSTRENLTKGSIVAELINKGLEIEKNMKNVLKQTNENIQSTTSKKVKSAKTKRHKPSSLIKIGNKKKLVKKNTVKPALFIDKLLKRIHISNAPRIKTYTEKKKKRNNKFSTINEFKTEFNIEPKTRDFDKLWGIVENYIGKYNEHAKDLKVQGFI